MLTTRDFVNIIKLMATLWLGLLFVVLLRQFAGTITLRDWNYDAMKDLGNITLRLWLPWLLLSPFLTLGIKKFPFYPSKLISTLSIHLGFLICFVLVHLSLITLHYHSFVEHTDPSMMGYAGWQHMGHFLIADPFFLTDVIVYVLFMASFNMGNYIQLIKQKEQDAVRLEASLMESKLRALQMQVNPHFLFNTLNSISVLVRKKDLVMAEEMIHRLSEFFRMTLEKSDTHMVPLDAEMELVENYLAIEQIRFRDRLIVEKVIEKRTGSVSVPAMILQPLVENSLRHGINKVDRPGVITIRSRLLGDRIVIEVSDNGAGCELLGTAQFKEGIGLSNVKARLQQLYGDDFVFSLRSFPTQGVVATIELPLPEDDIGGRVVTALRTQEA